MKHLKRYKLFETKKFSNSEGFLDVLDVINDFVEDNDITIVTTIGEIYNSKPNSTLFAKDIKLAETEGLFHFYYIFKNGLKHIFRNTSLVVPEAGIFNDKLDLLCTRIKNIGFKTELKSEIYTNAVSGYYSRLSFTLQIK